VIFYTDGSLCEGRAGAGVFSNTLDIRESYALGSLATVFQTEIYVIPVLTTVGARTCTT
jgi:hypothetical protein